MNIFVLSLNHAECAQMHADQHVGKMLLEACQILCCAHAEPEDNEWWHKTVEQRLKADQLPYYRTKAQFMHPCCVWVRQNIHNYRWLWQHAEALAWEYRHRFDKGHSSEQALIWLKHNEPIVAIQIAHCYPLSFCYPHKVGDKWTTKLFGTIDNVVQAYRTYYKETKQILRGKPATWTKRNKPEWF